MKQPQPSLVCAFELDNVRSESGAIVATVGFRPDGEVILLELTEACVGEEYLKELCRTCQYAQIWCKLSRSYRPDIRGSLLRGSYRQCSVGEAYTHWLVNVQPKYTS